MMTSYHATSTPATLVPALRVTSPVPQSCSLQHHTFARVAPLAWHACATLRILHVATRTHRLPRAFLWLLNQNDSFP